MMYGSIFYMGVWDGVCVNTWAQDLCTGAGSAVSSLWFGICVCVALK